jgi:hypothetical protein
MAQGTDATILAALLDHLGTLTFTPALQIAMPGIDFPAAGQAKPDNYLQTAFLPNGPVWRGIGNDPEGSKGILQVSVYWKRGIGHIKPIDVAGCIKDHFANRDLWAGATRIKINREPVIAPPIQESDRVQVPVSIYWQAFPQE